MPIFKTTYNILTKPWEDELWNPNWMDSDKIQLPPSVEWDYSRDLKIEDVDIWEVIYEQGGAVGLYAAWMPYAEFYMLRVGWWNESQGHGIETYYGAGSQKKLQKRIKELNLPIEIYEKWVPDSDMWLYENPEPKKLII